MSEIPREQHINNLYDLRDEILRLMPNNKEDREKYVQSVVYAINSLEVDEAYQLEYEHIPYITLDELKEIREEIEHCSSRYNLAREQGCQGQVVWSEYLYKQGDVLAILDKKKSELEIEDGNDD